MPELPEVETVRRGIEPHVLGCQIVHIVVRESRLRWPVPEELPERMRGATLVAVRRRAKYLLLETDRGCLIVHLGMSGSLRMVAADSAPLQHDHVDLVLDSGMALRFHDPRRFGCMLFSVAPLEHPLLGRLGPEPLSDDFDGERLYRLSRGRSTPVKSFIMDGQVVVGVGNIYAAEALFAAGVRPATRAGAVSLTCYKRLAAEIRRVLAQAITQGGTTLRDFVGGDGRPGYFQQKLFVYGRDGLPCRVCGTTLRRLKLGQRTTVWCPQCQK